MKTSRLFIDYFIGSFKKSIRASWISWVCIMWLITTWQITYIKLFVIWISYPIRQNGK